MKIFLLFLIQCGIYCGLQAQTLETKTNESNLQPLMPVPTLLFKDDFTYPGPRPNDNWVDDFVLINNTYSGNFGDPQPPSFGCASFDGLDNEWKPYTELDGWCDVLTSKEIDISGYDANDNVYLSFYLQPKGIGHFPNYCEGPNNPFCPKDRMVVEFKVGGEEGEWMEMEVIKGMDDDDFPNGNPTLLYVPEYGFYTIHLTDSEFFANDFQFRFRAYGRRGVYDIWNLDYVLLSEGEIPTITLPDIAFSQTSTNLLKRYHTMPWKHFYGFEEEELATNYDVALYNHFDYQNSIWNSRINVYDPVDNWHLVDDNYLLGSTDQNVPPNTYNSVEDNPFNVPLLASLLHDHYTGNEDLVRLRVDYEYTVNDEPDPTTLLGELVKHNNACSSTTIFDTYFSHDDGSAESFDNPPHFEEIAVQYHSNVEDKLYGVQIHFIYDHPFPPTDEEIDVYYRIGGLGYTPHYDSVMFNQKPVYLPKNNGFTTYIIKDESTLEPMPVTIPADTDFYVGFVPEEGTDVLVGVDLNSPQATPFQFKTYSNGWGQANVAGAYMIRPIMGDEFMSKLPTEMSLVDPPPGTTLDHICEDEDFTFRIELDGFPTGSDCEGDPIFINIECPELTPTLVAREPNLMPNQDGTYTFNKPWEFINPGVYTFNVYIESSCGGSYQSYDLTVVHSPVVPPVNFVCNNTSTGSTNHIQDDIYRGMTIRSAFTFCSDLPDHTLVKNKTDVTFIGGDQIKLYEGFKAEAGCSFLAKIGFGDCFQIDEMFAGEDPPKVEQRTEETQISLAEVEVYPNPFNEKFIIDLSISEASENVSIQLFDITGAAIKNIISDQAYTTGLHQLSIDGSELTPGMYFCKITVGDQSFVRKIIKASTY